MQYLNRTVAAFMCGALLLPPVPSLAFARHARAVGRVKSFVPAAYRTARVVTLADGRKVSIARGGMATVTGRDGKIDQMRLLSANLIPTAKSGTQEYKDQLFILASALSQKHKLPFSNDRVLVVFRDGVTAADHVEVSKSQFRRMTKSANKIAAADIPSYTNDFAVNAAMAKLGVSSVHRLFARISRATLSSMRARAQAQTGRPTLNVGNVFSVSISGSTPQRAVSALRALRGVAYASLDWQYGPASQSMQALPEVEHRALRNANVASLRSQAAKVRRESSASTGVNAVPSNYGLLSSFQTMLDASNVDAAAAYQEVVQQFHQLPGAGTTITNVSLGAIPAAEDAKSGPDCKAVVDYFGPFTHLIGGQRYIDWPGMPLIPAYAASPEGTIDPSLVSCGEGDLGEVGLDFSVMAPLPDDLQRPGAQADRSLGDLIGIAPGANYRLVVPATNNGGLNPTSVEAIDGALLGAALQTPAPDVITMSLGPAFDGLGLPSRYYEEDPISQSLISSIVNSLNIVVCVSAGDGTRNNFVAIGPSGGSTATDLTTDPSKITNLNDVALSSAPSLVTDSGSLDVGASTLNDIISMPPADPNYAQYVNQLAFPETRFDGSQDISSGYGTRVNISAPGDNIRMITKTGAAYNDVSVLSASGTSASAPEVAAGAAVAIQVARLTGHPFANARAVRDFLVQTSTPVLQAPQTDQTVNVGPQLNVRRAVEGLLANAGIHLTPAVNRIAVAQRRVLYPLETFGSRYTTSTDPTSINLVGIDYGNGAGPDGSGATDWITLAPDWQGIPDGAKFSLYVQGHPDKVISTARFARVLPSAILQAAGLTLASTSSRTVHLTYRAGAGHAPLAKVNFDLTFGPSDGTSEEGAAPIAPAVVSGQSFQVSYDITKWRHQTNPALVITEPGRPLASWLIPIHLPYVKPLTSPQGTLTVNVGDLQGGGTYAVAVLSTDPVTNFQYLSDPTLVRIQQGSAARAKAPLMQITGAQTGFGHWAEVASNGSVDLSWDATNVAGANGAMLEVSAPGPNVAFLFNTWNNPNGTIPDANGIDGGSVKLLPLPSVRGQATFKASDLGLTDAMFQTVRIIPMNGQNAAGEASDIGALVRDGVMGTLPNANWDLQLPPAGGFGVNPDGSNYIASWAPAGPGYFANVLDTFDGVTGETKRFANSLGSNAPWFVPGGGSLGGSADVKFVVQPSYPNSDFQQNFYMYGAPVVGQDVNSPLGCTCFTIPTGAMFLLSNNPGSRTGAALYYDTSGEFAGGVSSMGYGLFQAPLQLQQFDAINGLPVGNPIAVPALSNFGDTITILNADMTLNKAVVVRQPVIYWGLGLNPTIDVIDMGTGQTQEVASIGNGVLGSLAIDESSHVAMMNSVADFGLILFNVQTPDQQTKIFLPRSDELMARYNTDGNGAGYNPFTPNYIAADPVNHLFLVWQPWDTNILDYDFNTTGVLRVYDEQGTLVKSIKGWTYEGQQYPAFNLQNYLQVNGNLRKAYLMMADSQIAIIDY